jgi:DNA-binding MarR family transcriptional regulator
MRTSIYLGTMGSEYYDTWSLLRQTYAVVDRIIARKCQLFGITVPAYEVLFMVKYGPKPMSAYMLGHILGREHHSVVELVNRLKLKALITRTTIEGRPSLDITDTGSDLLARMLSSMPVIEELFESMDKDAAECLRKGLTPLRKAALQQLGLIDMGEIKLPAPDKLRGGAEPKGPPAQGPSSW